MNDLEFREKWINKHKKRLELFNKEHDIRKKAEELHKQISKRFYCIKESNFNSVVIDDIIDNKCRFISIEKIRTNDPSEPDSNTYITYLFEFKLRDDDNIIGYSYIFNKPNWLTSVIWYNINSLTRIEVKLIG